MPERTSTFSPLCALARATTPVPMSVKRMRRIQNLVIDALFRCAHECPNVAVGISHKRFRPPTILSWFLSDSVSRFARAFHRSSHVSNFEVWIHPPPWPRVGGTLFIPVPMSAGKKNAHVSRLQHRKNPALRFDL